jgi:hypothetical protein
VRVQGPDHRVSRQHTQALDSSHDGSTLAHDVQLDHIWDYIDESQVNLGSPSIDTARTLRRWILVAAGVLGTDLVFLLLTATATGDPALRASRLVWTVIVVLGIVGSIIAIRAASLFLDTAIERDDWPRIHEELWSKRAICQRYVLVWTLLLIGWLTSLVMVVSPALGSSELTHPTSAVAITADSRIPCPRCAMVAWASFDADGRMVTADLRGLSQAATFYNPGIVVVYDARDPAIAMARADYKAGKSGAVWLAVPISTAVFVFGTWALARLNARRRRRLSLQDA